MSGGIDEEGHAVCIVVSGNAGRLLEFYALVPKKVTSGLVPNCDSAHSWRLNSAARLGN